MISLRSLPLFLPALLFAQGSVPLVDFGADITWHGGTQGLPTYRATSATQLFKGSPAGENPVDVDGDGQTDDDSIAFYPFSLEEPLNPRGSFYNHKAPNTRFYGGLATFFANKRPQWAEGGINLDHELRDDFNLHSYATEGGDIGLRTYGLWFWQKPDFLNGGDQHPVSFDRDSRIAVFVSRYWKEFEEGRFIVRDGDRFFISEHSFGGKTHTLYELSPLESRWAAYEPRAPYDVAFDAPSATFETRDFQNVTAIGWYIAKPTLGRAALWLKWYAFAATGVVHAPPAATPSPETVSYALWRRVYAHANRNQVSLFPPYIFDRDGDMGDMFLTNAPLSDAAPVTDISALDAFAWCNARSEQEGLDPVFYADAEHGTVFREVMDRSDPARRDARPDVFVKWTANGYRPATASERGDLPGFVVLRGASKPSDADGALAEWASRFQPLDVSAAAGKPELRMVALPAGSYPRRDGATVAIQAFEMAATETTFAQWRRVYAWAIANGYDFDRDGDLGSMDWSDSGTAFTPDEPVTQISYLDAMLWCNALSEMEGRTPVYTADVAGTQVLRVARRFRLENPKGREARERLPDKGIQDVHARWHGDGYRLPSLWEWEYAYRSGNSAQNAFPWSSGTVTDHAWVAENSADKTQPVGRLAPNAFGLYDMAGNVFEWALGGGESYYLSDNPRGQGFPVPLGGSFRTDAAEQSLLLHMGGAPRVAITTQVPTAYPEIGFRVIRCASGTHPAEPPPYVPLRVFESWPDDTAMTGQLWRGNAGRTGEFAGTGPLRAPRELWRFNAGAPIRSSPVVFDGVVYVGSENGILFAIDLATGAEKWRYAAAAPVIASPAVFAGKVFILNARGMHAVDAVTGAAAWVKAGNFWADSPLVVPGPILHHSGRKMEGVVFYSEPWKGLVGLDTANGNEVWRYRDGHGPGNRGSSAFFHDGRLGWFRGSQATVITDFATERRVFEIDGGIDNTVFTPAARDGIVYSYINGVAAFPLRDAEGSDPRQRIAWRFGSDSPAWDHRHPGNTSFSVDDRAVYFGHNDKHVYALDKTNGALLWKTEVAAVVKSSPSLGSGPLLFVGSHNHNVYGIDKTSGAIVWTHPTGAPVHSSPTLTEGILLIGSDDGHLHALAE
jgi:outer membrane protein assembly factor BamB/formylglycine-generating enzyme required for sulfatase activity